jgi:hypothetical protein
MRALRRVHWQVLKGPVILAIAKWDLRLYNVYQLFHN